MLFLWKESLMAIPVGGATFALTESWLLSLFATAAHGYNHHATGLVIDPTFPHPLYVYSYGNFGGIFKSVDGGESRARCERGSETLFPYTLMIDPTSPDILYAGTTGVFKSIDRGENWTGDA